MLIVPTVNPVGSTRPASACAAAGEVWVNTCTVSCFMKIVCPDTDKNGCVTSSPTPTGPPFSTSLLVSATISNFLSTVSEGVDVAVSWLAVPPFEELGPHAASSVSSEIPNADIPNIHFISLSAKLGYRI